MISSKLSWAAMLALSAFTGFVQTQTLDPSIETPSGVTQCQVTSLNFFATHPPVVISAIPGAEVGQAVIETIVTTVGSPYAWLVNLPNATYFTLQIRDSIGGLQYSGPITVLPSANHSCVGLNPGGATVTTGTIPAPSGASVPPTSPASVPPSTPTGTTTGPTSPPPSSAGSTPASSPTTSSKSAAVKLNAAEGIIVSVGLMVAGLALSL